MNQENAKLINRHIIEEMHVGHMVESELRRQRRSVAWLASQLFCDRTNAYKLLKRRNIDIEQLIRIPCILNHNFLGDIAVVVDTSMCCSVE